MIPGMKSSEKQIFLVRYGEMALKGRNRKDFENRLRANIAEQLGIARKLVVKERGQIVVQCPQEKVGEARELLGKVFGISWYAPVHTCKSDLDEIVTLCISAAAGRLDETMSFRIRGQRSDKRLAFDSMDIERKAGEAVQKATGARVDLTDPDVIVYVNAAQEGSYVHTERLPGAGGLPVSSSGRVLCLLSGGFDSIAAAYHLAKRGARVDLLHFHAFAETAQAKQSKISEIAEKLSEWTMGEKLYLAGYFPFEQRVWGLDERDQRFELVVFRRLMVRVGERLAREKGYQALVLGDSLGQVASQTMENINAVDEAAVISIFRPLIGMDKQEVIERVKQMGLYELATAPYKDCCSIISRHPATRANLDRVKALERSIEMDTLVEEMAGLIEELTVGEPAKVGTVGN